MSSIDIDDRAEDERQQQGPPGQALARFAAGEDERVADYQTPATLAVQLSRAEIDQQIATARAMPRSITTTTRNILSLATMDEETAKECIYALPRAGKAIRGPSIRMAEIIASQWGNCRVGARVVHVDRIERFVEAEGVFHDLETNTATTSRVRRRLSDKRGRLLNEDMIVVTGNAAASIAKRNAILGGIPKAVWRRAYAEVEQVLTGDAKTLVERRAGALKAFAAFGVTPDRIFAALEVKGIDDVGLEEVLTLIAMHSALKNSESTVEEMFPSEKSADATTVRSVEEFAKGAGKAAQPEATRPAGTDAATAAQVAAVNAAAEKIAETAPVRQGLVRDAAAAEAKVAQPAEGEAKPAKETKPKAAKKDKDGDATAAPSQGHPPRAEEGAGAQSASPGASAPTGSASGGGTAQLQPGPAAAAADSAAVAKAPEEPLDAAAKKKLAEYAAALSNQMTPTGLRKAEQRVFGADLPDENTALGKAVSAIFDLHQKRVQGSVSPADADVGVKRLLGAL